MAAAPSSIRLAHGALVPSLRAPNSELRDWFQWILPNSRAVLHELNVSLQDAPLVVPIDPRVRGGQAGTVGTAFDYRARFHIADIETWELVAWKGARNLVRKWLFRQFDGRDRRLALGLGALQAGLLHQGSPHGKFFHYVDELVARLEPVGASLDAKAEAKLDRACVVLAWYEEVYRYGSGAGPLSDVPDIARAPDILALVPEALTTQVGELFGVFRGRFDPLLGGSVLLNPKLAGAGLVRADADLLVDGCLWELKTSSEPTVKNWWLYQVIGYALLDFDDQLGIDAVGLYLARRDWIQRWTLDDLLARLESRGSLEELRRQLRELLEASAHAVPLSDWNYELPHL